MRSPQASATLRPIFQRLYTCMLPLAVAALSCGAAEPVDRYPPTADDLLPPWATRANADTAAPGVVAPVPLERCGDTAEGFQGWVVSFQKHAVEQHIAPATAVSALASVRYDDEVIRLDRTQTAHKLPSAEFTRRHVTPKRVARGKALAREHAALFKTLESEYGVPPEILIALWGLETDFGDSMGSTTCLSALATLAWDCRRAPRFRAELLSALRILDKGDILQPQMVGAWAGEIGQTQFLPSSYEQAATDFDGDGRADLIGSSADALASTANYLKQHGWLRAEGYGTRSPNFAVLGTWNPSEVYRNAVVEFAARVKR